MPKETMIKFISLNINVNIKCYCNINVIVIVIVHTSFIIKCSLSKASEQFVDDWTRLVYNTCSSGELYDSLHVKLSFII